MAHFAKIDSNNVVTNVLVIDQAEIDTGNWGDPASWIKTSYNTIGGVYYIPNSSPPEPDPDQSKALRKNYAGIGMTYLPNGPSGEGFTGQQPYPSWSMNSFSYIWEAPIPYPADGFYYWDEATLSWILTPIPEMPSLNESGAPPNVIG
jgi:hypothetical protein